jgi:hypothetical protein
MLHGGEERVASDGVNRAGGAGRRAKATGEGDPHDDRE